MVLLSKIKYGDLSKYGINRPQEGPFALKVKNGKYPIIDVGTCKKIKSGEIQVSIYHSLTSNWYDFFNSSSRFLTVKNT